MVYKIDRPLPFWVKTWVWISSLICIIDGLFCVLRPHSLPGGCLEKVFFVYRYYIEIDRPYGDVMDNFVFSQGLLNLVEYSLNIVAVLMSDKRARVAKAMLTSLGLMGMWKTVLYTLYAYKVATGGRELAPIMQEFFFMVFPLCLWTLLPGYMACVFWREFLEVPKSVERVVAKSRYIVDDDLGDEEDDDSDDEREESSNDSLPVKPRNKYNLRKRQN